MIDIGTRREVLWDDFLIDTEQTTAEKRLHSPVLREKLMDFSESWEGDGTDYFNILREKNGLYRMYYLGWSMISNDGTEHTTNGIRVCYAESMDGLHWVKPDLGICEWEGSKHNNIILDKTTNNWDNFMVMRDPNEPEGSDTLYKGIGAIGTQHWQLWCFPSADGIHFSFEKRWMLTDKGSFDSLNTLFWDEKSKRYFVYLRGHHKADGVDELIRDIRVMTSSDFRTWTEPKQLDYCSGNDFALYTNNVSKYDRADHMFIGFPTRYVERPAWNDSFERLPGKEKRLARMKLHPRYGLAVTDCLFMCSRDGFSWNRYDEAFMRPGPEEPTNWIYGDCYPAYGLYETPGTRTGTENELSFLLPANHWMGIPTKLLRYTLRLDGFVSRCAGYEPKTLVTKPFRYSGTEMHINFSTSAIGSVCITLRAEDGTTVSSGELFGDSTDRIVGIDSAALRGKTVIMEATLRDADVYSFRFV